MKRTEFKQNKSRSRRLDWKPLMAAFQDALEWALNVAAEFARDYPDEVAAVERVRAYMHLSVAGCDVEEPIFDDLAFTFALFIGAIEREHGALGRFGQLIARMSNEQIERMSALESRHLAQLACSYWRMQSRARVAA